MRVFKDSVTGGNEHGEPERVERIEHWSRSVLPGQAPSRMGAARRGVRAV